MGKFKVLIISASCWLKLAPEDAEIDFLRNYYSIASEIAKCCCWQFNLALVFVN